MEIKSEDMLQYHIGWAKSERNKLLKETDWTQLNDCELSAEKVNEYSEYRKAVRQVVRDIIDTTPIVWPTPPTS
ncbi:phage tail assembly chaperone [Pseudoalteromonas sp. R3]|uniref:phage tail assembly chaperone n=1 Tax=Pseudoalteromonas sp. R3 TaxID=1709477 RepID=UPI0006B48C99|nr:phage tail assembly chaperone [Pseudoalteromonas sp. R3]AZZ98002.1 hypothetical protein ELR70_13290 [Pseudoalteromonas sp. R3]